MPEKASALDQALAGHLSGDRQAHIGQHGGGDIRQAAAFTQLDIPAANGHKGHHVGGVGGEGGAVRVCHLLRIAMVSREESAAACGQNCLYHFLDGGIHSLHSLDGGIVHTGCGPPYRSWQSSG